MAIVSTHALDAVGGHHAAGLRVRLERLTEGDAPVTVFDIVTDAGGRMAEAVEVDPYRPGVRYELQLAVGDYVAGSLADAPPPALDSVVLRFAMSDASARYHFPLSITPASCSVLAVVQPG